MKQTRKFLPLIAALIVSACGGDSALPNPTGKADVSAINAIRASSLVDFRIEERSLGTISYGDISISSPYDDFTYTFNFDIFFAGDSDPTRIASETIEFTADQDYTLLLSGTVAAPTVTVWETSERTFDSADTVFQARFAHTADLLAAETVDVYFAPDGTVPVAGEQVATASFGEISAPMDFEQGEYVVTLTTAGDVNDVLYVSSPTEIAQRSNLIITPFDGTVNQTAPIVVRALGASGIGTTFADPSSPALIQFLHAAGDLTEVDVYDDVDLTSQVFDDLSFQQLTPEQTINDALATYGFTPFDNTGSVYAEVATSTEIGRRYRIYFSGSDGEYTAVISLPDRKPVDTSAKIVIRNESDNFAFVNVYAMEPGEVPDENSPVARGALSSGTGSATLTFAEGMYDFYLTESATTDFNLIAGPLPLDIAYRDVVELMIFDNVADPAIVDLVELVETP